MRHGDCSTEAPCFRSPQGWRGLERAARNKSIARPVGVIHITSHSVERWLSGLRHTPGKRAWLKPTEGSNPSLSASCIQIAGHHLNLFLNLQSYPRSTASRNLPVSLPITIRLGTPSDAPIIANYNALLAQETEHLELEPVRLRAGVDAVLADATKGTYWVAEAGGEVVGQLMITFEWSDWRNGVFWWIQSVYVRQDWRARGVFKALYDHVYQLAKARSDVCGLRLYVEGDNQRAQRTYQRLGLRPTNYHLYEVDFRIARPDSSGDG